MADSFENYISVFLVSMLPYFHHLKVAFFQGPQVIFNLMNQLIASAYDHRYPDREIRSNYSNLIQSVADVLNSMRNSTLISLEDLQLGLSKGPEIVQNLSDTVLIQVMKWLQIDVS